VNRLQKKLKRLLVIFLMPIIFSFSGCIYLVVGGIGALGGYIVSPDTVEGLTENDKDTAWDAAKEIVQIMGHVDNEMEDGGLIVATIAGAKVEVLVSTLTESAVRIRVKARKNYLPKISLAQDVFVKIMSYLNE